MLKSINYEFIRTTDEYFDEYTGEKDDDSPYRADTKKREFKFLQKPKTDKTPS